MDSDNEGDDGQDGGALGNGQQERLEDAGDEFNARE